MSAPSHSGNFRPIAVIRTFAEAARMKLGWLPFAMVGLLCGCATLKDADQPNAFQNPSGHLNKRTTVCGFLSGAANVSPSKDSLDGLNVEAGRFATQLLAVGENEKVCLSGTIIYAGCHSGSDVICTDWAHDYTMRVEGIY